MPSYFPLSCLLPTRVPTCLLPTFLPGACLPALQGLQRLCAAQPVAWLLTQGPGAEVRHGEALRYLRPRQLQPVEHPSASVGRSSLFPAGMFSAGMHAVLPPLAAHS